MATIGTEVKSASWRTVKLGSGGLFGSSSNLSNIHGLASRNGNFYVATGWRYSPKSSVHKITPSGSISQLTNLRVSRYDVASCIVEEADGKGYIYVIGGHNEEKNLTTVERYDIANNTFKDLPRIPTAREDAVAVPLNGKIYVIGGTNVSNLNLVEVFDIKTQTWSTGVPTKYTHSAHSGVVSDGKIYIIGGRGTGARKVEVFDPATGVWTEKASMPMSLWHHGVDVMNGNIFVCNGESDNDMWNNSPRKLYVYNTITNTWKELAAPPNDCDRHGFAFLKPNDNSNTGKAYIFMGWNSGFNGNVYELTVTFGE